MGESFLIKRPNNYKNRLVGMISVTYPEGSTCTCTNVKGDIVLEDENTNGKVIFNIPEAGTWTVKSINGSSSASQSVSISEGQIENVTLSYKFYLFKEGTGLMNNTGLYYGMANMTGTAYQKDLPSGNSSIAYISKDSFYLASGLGSAGGGLFGFTSRIDMTSYKNLFVDLKANSTSQPPVIGVSSSQVNSFYPTWAASTNITKTTRDTYSVDLSKVNSNQYVGITFLFTDGTVYNVWLE